ncbi:MAG: TVP38/TMEM64 family protein [Aureispira sp.]
MSEPFETNKEKRPQNGFMRIGILFGFLVLSILLIKYTVIGTWLSLENLQYMVAQAGVWGFVVFVGMFLASAVLNVPGTPFLLLGILLFGYWEGALLAYIGTCIGAWVTFTIGRKVGGQALSDVTNPTIRNLLAEAETRPIRTLIVLRILVQLSPIVGYTLALTNIKERQYLVGNLIGILLPIIGLSLGMYFFEDGIRHLFGIEASLSG